MITILKVQQTSMFSWFYPPSLSQMTRCTSPRSLSSPTTPPAAAPSLCPASHCCPPWCSASSSSSSSAPHSTPPLCSPVAPRRNNQPETGTTPASSLWPSPEQQSAALPIRGGWGHWWEEPGSAGGSFCDAGIMSALWWRFLLWQCGWLHWLPC